MGGGGKNCGCGIELRLLICDLVSEVLWMILRDAMCLRLLQYAIWFCPRRSLER